MNGAAYLILLGIIACATACGRAQRSESGSAAPDAQTSADSLCGALSVVGSMPAVMVQLDTAPGRGVMLTGDERPRLTLLHGLEVCVRGASTSDGWRVDAFRVSASAGEPAVDGVLVESGGSYSIRTVHGREVRLSFVPDRLRGEVGQRVWVVLDDSARVTAMGIIR